MSHHLRFALACVLIAGTAAAQQQYPEGAAIPRGPTEVESVWLLANPLAAPEAVTPPPTGPVHCAAEYEPMESIVIAWEGSNSWLTILATMAGHITTTGNADVYVAVDTTTERASALTRIAATGADMGRVHPVVVTTDTIWIRDYGPRYIFQGDCRAVVDHTYNRPRPQDNAFNSAFAPLRGHALYELGLVHGGGNYHLDAQRRSRTTRLINNENATLTEPEIHDIWRDYQNVDTRFYQPFPRSVDSTQHIDMWMQVIADNAVMISDWPFNPGSTQDQICDAAAESMIAEGHAVHRVPARSVGGVHYTYTNVVMCNGLVLIPSYTSGQVAQHNAQALAAWQAALPNKTIVQVDCQGIVTSAGVMHCIAMHVPAHRGGLDPTAYLINLNGGEVLAPGSQAAIEWITDDDEAVQDVDLLLSTDGGATFSTVLAAGIPDTGSWIWNVPDVCSPTTRVRVLARDGQGRTGFDDSDGDFVLSGGGCAAESVSYGGGSTGQLGVPTLSSGTPLIGGPLDLTLGQAWPGAAAVLFVGSSPTAVPFAGGALLVQPVVHLNSIVPGSGTATFGLTIPPISALAGQSIFWQGWVAGDPGAVLGLASTAGLETRLGF